MTFLLGYIAGGVSMFLVLAFTGRAAKKRRPSYGEW